MRGAESQPEPQLRLHTHAASAASATTPARAAPSTASPLRPVPLGVEVGPDKVVASAVAVTGTPKEALSRVATPDAAPAAAAAAPAPVTK